MIRVAIIEDENEIRENLCSLINGSEGYMCIANYETAEAAIEDIQKILPDVALMDINLGGISGIEAVALLKPICPKTQFMMLTSLEDTELVFKALKAGATGYLTKTTRPSQLLDSITDLHKGGSPMSSNIARLVVESFSATREFTERAKLSNREKEILDLLSKGFRYKEIGDKLFISTETVRTHIRNIYEKLEVNSRTDAINKVYGQH